LSGSFLKDFVRGITSGAGLEIAQVRRKRARASVFSFMARKFY